MRRFLLLLLVFGASIGVTKADKYSYCLPSNSTCWPTSSAIQHLQSSLTNAASLVQGSDGYVWLEGGVQRSTNLNQQPGFIIYVLNNNDVEAAVKFAIQYNIRIAVRNSGHEYNGRSTAYGSVLVDLSRFNAISVVKTPSGTLLSVSPGNNWGDAYDAVAKINGIVVGHDPTVGCIGLSLGGGHGAFARQYGLSSDNVVQYTILVANNANGDVKWVNASSSSNTDLFWALKGAGASSFGIVTQALFKVFPAPKAIQVVYLSWPLQSIRNKTVTNVGQMVLNRFMHNSTWWSEQPNQFLGWGSVSAATDLSNKIKGMLGSIGMEFLYTGSYQDSLPYMNQFQEYHPEWYSQGIASVFHANFSTYYDYSVANADQSSWYRSFISNVFVSPRQLNTGLTNTILNYSSDYQSMSFFYNMVLGGQISAINSSDSSVSSGFRDAIFELGPSRVWLSPADDQQNMGIISNISAGLFTTYSYSYTYEYTSVENYNVISDWQNRFWGSNFQSLQTIKQKWDPCNIFWIRNAVGYQMPHGCN